MAFRDDIKLQVQQSTNLVDLIGEQLLLKHKGREFVGLCPFHEDRNPSMYVSPAKQIFHCFVCGAGGDAFGWMMKFHKMTFPEALRFLAERAGIKIEETGDRGQSTGANERQVIGEANGLAVMFFQKLFRHPQQGATARAYIDKRQIPKELIEAFQIGYAPDGWDGLVKQIAANKWNQRGFELAGLISSRDKGSTSDTRNPSPGFYDRLRHRIIFPICDGLGRPIAFGGRKIREEDEPKYLNSPETALFNKSRTLYGLHLAKKAIIDTRTAIIVEGYVDVIACHAMGTANVVATLGTALTAEHVRELRKYCDNIVLVFDADVAGEKAADRGTDAFFSYAIEMVVMEQIDISFARVPGGKDPGDLMLMAGGATLWKQAIDNSEDAFSFQLGLIKGKMASSHTMTGMEKIAEEYLRKIASLDHLLKRAMPLRRSLVIQRISELLQIPADAVLASLKKFAPAKRAPLKVPLRQGGAERQTSTRTVGGGEGLAPPFSDGALENSLSERPRNEISQDSSPFSEEVVTDNADFANTTQSEKSQHLAYSDVASTSESANIGLVRAERQFMGCLLREPGLFHLTLSDGRPVDEAIMPGELVTPIGRQLYEVMYEHLADGAQLTLSMLLAELAQRDEPKLAELATVIEKEVDDMTAASSATNRSLSDKLVAAAAKILEHHRMVEQRQQMTSMMPGEPATADEALRKAMELRKTQRSPLSIMRTTRE